jgi:hypothetical protein
LLLPLLLTTLERALQYGESLDARGFGSGRRSRYRPLHWSVQDRLVLIASLVAIVAIAVLPGVPYNPYQELVPSVPDPDQLLAVGLLAVPAVSASLSRVDHAPHHA